MSSAPSAILVGLVRIEVDRSKVTLVFRDSNDDWHRKTYSGETFMEALPSLGSDRARTRSNGLKELDVLSQGAQMYLYLDCGLIAQMGSLQGGPALQLLQLMLPSSPRPQMIIGALRKYRDCNVENIFHTGR